MIVKRRAGEIKDPVHGYIYFSEAERKLIDSLPLQRLRRIRQLAGSELTYPGACHTRFLHSLGVMHLSGLMAERLVELGYVDEDCAIKLRLAGLLHDVGHGPFSHVYEEVLRERRGLSHEDLTVRIIEGSELKDLLSDEGFDEHEIAKLCVGGVEEVGKRFLNQVVVGRLSPDTMDYILRDSYFTGVGFGQVDVHRLIDSLDVIDDQLAVDCPGGLYVLEAFIIARLELFNAVYFHRTVRAANVMLSRAMSYADEYLGLTEVDDVGRFLSMDDARVEEMVLSLEGGVEAKVARELMSMYRARNLLKSTFEVVIHGNVDSIASQLERASVRRRLEEEVAEEAGVDPHYVIVDAPSVLSMPVHPKDGAELLVLRRGPRGREALRVTKVSPLLSSLSRFTDVVRVYTLSEHRNAVAEACGKVFGEGGLLGSSLPRA